MSDEKRNEEQVLADLREQLEQYCNVEIFRGEYNWVVAQYLPQLQEWKTLELPVFFDEIMAIEKALEFCPGPGGYLLDTL